MEQQTPFGYKGIRCNMTKQNTGFTTAHMDVKLHEQIKKEASRNGVSFSEQIREYRDKSIVLEGTVQELKEEIRLSKMHFEGGN